MSSADSTVVADCQHAFAQAVKDYADLVSSGHRFCPFPATADITATDVVVACSRMLEAVDVEIFELAMWEVLGDR